MTRREGRLGSAWRAWVELWAQRESATSLALLRISVAAVMLLSLLSVADAGLVEVLWLSREHGGLVRTHDAHWFWALLGSGSADAPTRAEVWSVYALTLGAGTLGLVGLGGRWPLLVAQQGYVALTSLNGHSSGSYDNLVAVALLLLACSRSTATLSVDCLREHGRWRHRSEVYAWPRYLLLLQLLLMYTATGLQKIGLSWTPMGGYTALYYVLHDPTWIRYAPSYVAALDPLLRACTALTWHWEQLSLLMLVVLYYRATAERPGRLRALLNRYDLRIAWASIGVGMHLGILLLMNVGPFSWISLACYLSLFRPEELEAAGRRLRRRWVREERPA